MRYARPKPSIVLATVAVVAVASPLAVHMSGTSLVPVDNTSEVAETEIDQISLEDVPSVVLDLATSGLADAGITLPEIDPADFNLPDIQLPGLDTGSLGGSTPESSTSPSSSAPSSSPSTSQVPDNEGTDSDNTDSNGLASDGTESETAGSETAEPGQPTPASEDAAAPGAEETTPDGRPVGAMVKHLVRDDPFKMVAFTWDANVPVDLLMRSKSESSNWSEWSELHTASGAGDVADDTVSGTEPEWLGEASEVQLAVADNGLAMPAAANSDGFTEIIAGSATELLMSLATQALSTLSAIIINPQGLLDLGSSILSPPGGPQIISRLAWGANESQRCSQPRVSPALRGAIVHHTAGSNDYTPIQSADIVRGIYAYHTQTLGWCDIGYNALVDKYGQIFEGAAGGLDQNVQATHTGGFNKETVGVSMIGNYEEVVPTPQLVNSVGRFLRWRLGLANVNPYGTAQLTAEGFSGSRYSAGTVTNLPAISGHRDYGNTLCPGQFGYAALDQIRAIAGGVGGGGNGAGWSDLPAEEAPPEGGQPPGEVPPGEVPPGEAPPGEVPPGEVPPGEEPLPGDGFGSPDLPAEQAPPEQQTPPGAAPPV